MAHLNRRVFQSKFVHAASPWVNLVRRFGQATFSPIIQVFTRF